MIDVRLREGEVPKGFKRGTPRACAECGHRTNGGKKYCMNHIHLMPYIQKMEATK